MGMRDIFYFKNRAWFYLIIIILHMQWFYRTGYIPSPGEALIFITFYWLFAADSIEMKLNDAKRGDGGLDNGK